MNHPKQQDPYFVARKRLTDEAQDQRTKWGYMKCVCHLGNPPCGCCTHPGHPLSQAEDESCWYTLTDDEYAAECRAMERQLFLDNHKRKTAEFE